jgi:histone H1/5
MTSKLSYFEMIEDAILTLAERKGSTRQAIWKFISIKYPEADYKQFLVRLKKVKENNNIEPVGTMRFKLSSNYRKKLLTALKKGVQPKAVQKSKATMKNSSKRKAAKTAKKGSAKRTSSKGSVKRTSAKGKAAKGGKKMTKRGSKSGAGKKTSGSKKTQQKRNTKKAMNQKKKSMNKARNSKKGGKSKAKKGGKTGKKTGGSAASKGKAAKAHEQHDSADQGGQDHDDKAASPRVSSRR